ncbi:hypothetical protein RSAG8_04758, partial [Rhizoctonia solani AG-8 WAC10335]
MRIIGFLELDHQNQVLRSNSRLSGILMGIAFSDCPECVARESSSPTCIPLGDGSFIYTVYQVDATILNSKRAGLTRLCLYGSICAPSLVLFLRGTPCAQYG